MVELSTDSAFSSALPNQHSEDHGDSPAERKVVDGSLAIVTPLDRAVKEAEKDQSGEKDGQKREADRLYVHLRDNMQMIREFCKEMVQQIPIPDQCVIEGNACFL